MILFYSYLQYLWFSFVVTKIKDTDKDGFINKDDLKKVFKNLGISLEDEARILKIGDRKKLIITSQEVVVVKYSDH